jgi:alkaline phosphatase D
MLGYSEMKEVMIWVQTTKPAEIKILYTNVANSNEKNWTNTVNTTKEDAFTAHLIADIVEPGQKYDYELYINNKKIERPYKLQFQTLPIWEWRTDPPEFSFAAGSGAYINETQYDRPGTPYGGDYQIFENILSKNPDFMIWAGDNVYLREADWNSRTGIIHRYTHDRSTPEMQALLASVHNYAIWDDHDFGPNDSDGSFWNKNETLNAFKLFWANPSYGVGDIKGAITFFNWGDCDFLMLDNRFYRTPDNRKTEKGTQLGKEQIEWLKNSLVYSHANFKFVVIGGQFLNTSGFYETYSNYSFAEERAEIIEFIQKEKIENVIFITGDRHSSEVNVLKRANCPTIYDITISPLTSHHATASEKEVNSLRVAGSLINQRNFATFNISGKYKERIISINFFDSNGKEIYKYSIKKETPADYFVK